MSELCPSAVRAVTLSGCGGGGAAVTNKTGYKKKNKCSSFPSPHENIPILSAGLVNTWTSVICVSFLNSFLTVTGFVCQDKCQDEETK